MAEGIDPDAGDAVGDRDVGQVPAIVERPVPDVSNTVGNRDAAQLAAPLERPPSMLATLSGIVTLVRLPHEANALSPMLVTCKPLIVSGMMTSPPGPVYPVMVIVPLVVV